MDCDMLCRTDIVKLWEKRNKKYAVQVIKHDHVPKETKKFLDRPQSAYAKKNWSSVMMFNNSKCKALTPAYVNTAHGLDLHQFKWLNDDNLIGSLPKEWNHLVDVQPENLNAKIAHFTLAGPYFHEARNCEFSEEWRADYKSMIHCEQKNG